MTPLSPYVVPGIYPGVLKKAAIKMPDSLVHLRRMCAIAIGIPVTDIMEKGKTAEQVRAKQLFAWYANRAFGNKYTFAQLGSYCGAHEHTTIVHRIKISDRYFRAKDRLFMEDYRNLLSLLDSKYIGIEPSQEKRDRRKVQHIHSREIMTIKDGAIRSEMPYTDFYNILLTGKNLLPYRFI